MRASTVVSRTISCLQNVNPMFEYCAALKIMCDRSAPGRHRGTETATSPELSGHRTVYALATPAATGSPAGAIDRATPRPTHVHDEYITQSLRHHTHVPVRYVTPVSRLRI